MNNLSVNLVTWNGAKYIPFLFDSLKKQTFKDWELLIWDNDSKDTTLKILEKESAGLSVPCQIFESPKNLGFAGGHNKLYKKIGADYFVLLNQDVYLSPDCFTKMFQFMEEREDCSAVAPRLMKWNFDKLEEDYSEGSIEKKLKLSLTDTVDSLGLEVMRNRQVREYLSQEIWSNHSKNRELIRMRNKNAIEVFGVSGALAMFRKKAIEDVAPDSLSFLDETYHAYKEDVDLAFRLRLIGYHSFVMLDTVAYHDRTGHAPLKNNLKNLIKNKKTQPAWVRYHSYKNHLITLYKNEYWQNFVIDFPYIFWYELKKIIWFLLFDRSVLMGYKEIRNLWSILQKKRKIIKKKRTLNWRDMRRWWSK